MVRTSSENLEKDFGFYYFAKEVLIKKQLWRIWQMTGFQMR